MKQIRFLTLFLLALLFCGQANAGEPLRTGFRTPPSVAKARTWWHWINGNVTKAGITADLEAMQRVGIQEAQIFNVDQGYPEGPAPYLSPQWLELLKFAATEAKRLGMELAFHNGAGWSSSGGPWITPENAMQTVVFSETTCEGGKAIEMKLPQPPTKFNCYREIAVLAFPTPQSSLRIDNRELKTLSENSIPNRLQPDNKDVPQDAVIKKSEIINLTHNVSADGTLKWKSPAGKWTIVRLGYTPTGAENRPANAEGRGLECDKMSRAAVDEFWNGGVRPILEKLGPLVGESVTSCLIDSYEVGCGNWTSGFEQEFSHRCAYDCMPYLPALAGYYVESGEVTERFLWDFRKTVGDLMADNYYKYFSELCHRHGMKFSVEPYGGPFNTLETGAVGDVPMTEFWVGQSVFPGMSKMAASIAHLNGTAEVGAEAFTSISRWLNHPAILKPLGDWSWSEGVNRLIFHSYAHQPWNNVYPGVTFHMYGTEMSRFNTWWEPGKAYMDYLARSQFLLQQGHCVADVLAFVGESSPNNGTYCDGLKNKGYDFDEIGTNMLDALSVKNGLICTPAGGAYRVLVLTDDDGMTPKLLHKLKKLTAQGAFIIGRKPSKSMSLTNFPQCDVELNKLADELWGTGDASGAPIRDITLEEALEKMNLTPDFSAAAGGSDLLFIHRATSAEDIYFIANQQRQARTETCEFRVTGKVPELWNAETGKTERLAAWETVGDKTRITLDFAPQEAYFIVFGEPDGSVESVASYSQEVSPVKSEPLPQLTIHKAEYGYFLSDGMADVKKLLLPRIKDNKLHAVADNSLVGDIAPGVLKELRLEYSVGGKTHRVIVPENKSATIPRKGEAGEFKLLKAFYGSFAPGFEWEIPEAPVDITQLVNEKIAAGELQFTVDDRLIGKAATSGHDKPKKLCINYSADGEDIQCEVLEGGKINLAKYAPEPRLAVEDNRLVWITPKAGKAKCTTATGKVRKARVKSVPAPIVVEGAWDVSFKAPTFGTPDHTTFDRLMSWTESTDENIRYFSGTAVYRKAINLPKAYTRAGRTLELDLGRVCVMAEVFVNGKSLGVLWKAPFRIDLGDAVHAGTNDLEIHVTNLWPNRLIGDARYPDDCDWGDWLLNSWPEWIEHPERRDSPRHTFTTWRHWGADDPLLTSGLLGPVVLRPFVHAEMK